MALTRGSGGGAGPIDVRSHDPIWCVGAYSALACADSIYAFSFASDMLAWAHEAIASEMDAAVVLFGGGGGVAVDTTGCGDGGADAPVGASAGGRDAVDGGATARAGEAEGPAAEGGAVVGAGAFVGIAMSGVVRPLVVRLEQVIASQVLRCTRSAPRVCSRAGRAQSEFVVMFKLLGVIQVRVRARRRAGAHARSRSCTRQRLTGSCRRPARCRRPCAERRMSRRRGTVSCLKPQPRASRTRRQGA